MKVDKQQVNRILWTASNRRGQTTSISTDKRKLTEVGNNQQLIMKLTNFSGSWWTACDGSWQATSSRSWQTTSNRKLQTTSNKGWQATSKRSWQ